MASWKKVVVSGSSAELASLTTSGNLTVNGNTTLGNSSTDLITANSSQLELGAAADTTTIEVPSSSIIFNASNTAANGKVTYELKTGVIPEGNEQSYTLTLPSTTGTLLVAGNVALGSGTTGDYVKNLGTGTGVTIGSNSGEGSEPTIAVNYGSSANTAVQGNTSLTIQGTTNEVSVTGGSITLGSGGTVTIGLPDSVSITSDLTVGGNLYVNGTVSEISTTNLLVKDPFILLRSGSTTRGDSGIIFGGSDATTNQGSMLFWDSSYNSNDGRLSIKHDVASDSFGDDVASPNYQIAGVFSGSDANSQIAKADHLGNIRVFGDEIFIYG